MNCPNCGTLNNTDSRFCIKCGMPFNQNTNMQNISTVAQTIDTNTSQQVDTNISQQVDTQTINNTSYNQSSNTIAPLNFISYIIAVMLRPFQCFKEEETKLSEPKNSLILVAIVSVAMMVVTFITSMINVIFVKKLNSSWKYVTTVDFSKLKDLDYVSLIGKNLLIYMGIIAAIAGVYYIASLIAKKSVNFMKTLSITATSFIPYILLGMIVAPIVGKIWNILSLIFIVIGFIYAIAIFVTLMSENVKFENQDSNIYFHLICISVIIISGYYLLLNVVMKGLNFLDFLS